MPNMKARAGFTVFEIIMVLVIFLILVSVSVPFYSYFQTFSASESAKQEVLETIRLTQAKAIAGENNSNHGVYYSDTEWTTYQGINYASRVQSYDQVFELPSNLSFVSSEDLNFEINTGIPSSTNSIDLTNTTTEDTQSIYVNSLGLLE